jgi:hypothetical protein
MRLRVPNDQYSAAIDYLHEHGYQVTHTKPKSNNEILIVAKRATSTFNAYHWIMPESLEYLEIRDKFNGRKKYHLDKPEAK